MVDCSEKLRALRDARGLTQLQVANRIGVSKAMVSAYETASKAPSIEVLIRLSRLFGVSVDYLVCVDLIVIRPLECPNSLCRWPISWNC